MRFSMSAAWNDATALMQRNKEVLAIVAGVFFLLPSLVMAVLFAEQQAQAMTMVQSMLQGQVLQEDGAVPLQAVPGWFIAVGLGLFLVQLIGYLALLAIMDDRRRPTVGEAIGMAFKCLLPLIGAFILFVIGYFVCALLLSLLVGVVVAGIGAATGSTAISGGLTLILSIAVLVAVFYVLVRLSLTLAEMVLGQKLNPIKAYAGSWRLTQGNSFRLFLFYLLLLIVYVVISMVIFGVLLGALGLTLSPTASGLVMGLISGVVGAVFGVVAMAIVAATYRQLAGPSAEAVRETFE